MTNPTDVRESRKLAATLARRHLEGSVTAQTLVDRFAGTADPLILLLLDIVIRQPRRGFFGIGERTWQRTFRDPLMAVIEQLDKGELGRIPAERLVPPVSRWAVIGWTLFTLLAGGSVADALLRWSGVLPTLPPRRVEPITIIMWGVATVIGILMLRGMWAQHKLRTRQQLRE